MIWCYLYQMGANDVTEHRPLKEQKPLGREVTEVSHIIEYPKCTW